MGYLADKIHVYKVFETKVIAKKYDNFSLATFNIGVKFQDELKFRIP